MYKSVYCTVDINTFIVHDGSSIDMENHPDFPCQCYHCHLIVKLILSTYLLAVILRIVLYYCLNFKINVGCKWWWQTDMKNHLHFHKHTQIATIERKWETWKQIINHHNQLANNLLQTKRLKQQQKKVKADTPSLLLSQIALNSSNYSLTTDSR
jgi:hypothetical protein